MSNGQHANGSKDIIRSLVEARPDNHANELEVTLARKDMSIYLIRLRGYRGRDAPRIRRETLAALDVLEPRGRRRRGHE
jgi:hypothetical protein